MKHEGDARICGKELEKKDKAAQRAGEESASVGPGGKAFEKAANIPGNRNKYMNLHDYST